MNNEGLTLEQAANVEKVVDKKLEISQTVSSPQPQ